MMSLLRSIIGLTLVVMIGGFAVLNRENIAVTLSPIHEPLEFPLYIIMVLSLLTGFLIGSFVVWFNHGQVRKTRRQQKKQIKTLEKELAKTTKTTKSSPPDDFFPALPHKS